MKTRRGFVSNSSSSSFIVGIAEIIDKAKFDEYIEKNEIVLGEYGDRVIIYEDSKRWDVKKHNDKLIVENFETLVSTERKKLGTMFFVTNISNDEGDGPFWNEGTCDMDYNIDIDFFSDDQRKIYEMFSDTNSGLNMDNQVTFGAARNG